MKLISWNIDSLNAALTSDSARALLSRDVLKKLAGMDADIIALQETKLSAKGPTKKHIECLEEIFPAYDHVWRSSVEPARKGYAGDGLKRLEDRQEWDKKYADYLEGLAKNKPVLACGDYNVAHKEIDLANPASNHRSPGFTDEEREGFTNLLARGFVDTFRHVHGDIEEVYSWWAQRVKTSKVNNTGWRIDYWIVSQDVADKVRVSEMVDSGERQDHAPILLEVEF